MKILCIDTSSKLCSVAILDDFNVIDKIELDNGLTHSETLMPLIEKILNQNNLKLKDIDLIIVDIGPGSFTGIRIGVATAKAFSDALNIPCIGISSLEVLAYSVKKEGLICSAIDCKNSNCYFSIYELKDNIYNVIENPRSENKENILNLINTKYKNYDIKFVGDAIPYFSDNLYLNVENLGIAGLIKYKQNNFICEDVLPLYLKKPQAQKQLEEKLKNSCTT